MALTRPSATLSRGERGRSGRFSASGMAPLLASEVFAGVVGFGVMVELARRLGPSGFADFEVASAVGAWWLVVVRGGFDPIVYREAARRPKLVGPLTDLLIGLRLASAVVAVVAILGFAWVSGSPRGWVVAASGLVLIPSALACDVGARASGRFGVLGLAQATRAVGLAVGAWWLVARPGRAPVAMGCVVAAEALSSTVLLLFHGPIRPRFRARAWAVLARRGAVAGATRFGRVSLYAADILAIGWWVGPGLGPYAAARRVAFALLALGLVVPSAVAPRVARAWASGPGEARSEVGRTIGNLLMFSLPPTVGLIATSDRWMPLLFGEGFREGGPWLALIAARLPIILVSNVQQSAMVACRREGQALGLILGMVALAGVLLPTLALADGTRGVALAILGVELAGAVAGWFSLRKSGLAPAWHHGSGPALVASAGVAVACWAGRSWGLGWVVLISGAWSLLVMVASRAFERRAAS